MNRTLVGAVGLAALWLLMSGLWDKWLILVFGALSIVLTIIIGKRMDMADGERLDYSLSPVATAKYLLWLLVEIAKSNWTVTKIIFSRGEPQRQKLFMVPITQETDMAQVVFANSITLTPGTITVETEQDQFIVHALDFDDTTMDSLADMDGRVTAIESGKQTRMTKAAEDART